MNRGHGVSKGKGLFSAALLCLIAALLLFGCSRATPTPQPAVIRFACLDEDLGYYETLARSFTASHRNTAIKVLAKRQAALAALGPDDSDTFAVYLPLGTRPERGDLLSLDSRVTDKADFYPCTLAAFTRNGQLWALPTGADPVLMYYNKGLFDERQVSYPRAGWTWDGFLQTAKQLRDAERGIYGYAAGLWREEPWLFVLQHGGRVVDDWLNPTRASFDNAQTAEALQWYAALIFEHDVSANAYEARQAFGDGGVFGGVTTGKVGMWADYYSSRLALAASDAPAWGATVLPHDREQATLANVEAVAISARAANPDLCWQWIEFLSRQVPTRLAPTRRSVVTSQPYAERVGAELAAAVDGALPGAVVLPQEPASFYRKLGSAWTEAMDDLFAGRVDINNAMQRIQRDTNK